MDLDIRENISFSDSVVLPPTNIKYVCVDHALCHCFVEVNYSAVYSFYNVVGVGNQIVDCRGSPGEKLQLPLQPAVQNRMTTPPAMRTNLVPSDYTTPSRTANACM